MLLEKQCTMTQDPVNWLISTSEGSRNRQLKTRRQNNYK